VWWGDEGIIQVVFDAGGGVIYKTVRKK